MKNFITVLLILLLGDINCHAIQTNIPQKPAQTNEIQFERTQNENFLNLFFSFIGGLFNRITGKNSGPIVKSQDVTTLSNTIKTYQVMEEKSNPEYSKSQTKDKTDFSIGILDLAAGILKLFE